ncbi:MAG TPA: ChaB family protein [Streptosporangiaceae bacterium]|nr:ChaB family protein [Streptosporangiaceae bacterium]
MASGAPGTLKRSPAGAQETFTRALAGAVQACGDGGQADRAAYAEFKRAFEKRGGHWIPKQARLRFTRAQEAGGSRSAFCPAAFLPAGRPPGNGGDRGVGLVQRSRCPGGRIAALGG